MPEQIRDGAADLFGIFVGFVALIVAALWAALIVHLI